MPQPGRRSAGRLGVGYGTDTGPRIRLATEFRRLNRRGHYADGDVRLSTSEQSVTARYNIPVGFPNPSLWTITGRYGRIEWVTSKTLQGIAGLSFAHLRGDVREVFSIRYQHDDFQVAADTGRLAPDAADCGVDILARPTTASTPRVVSAESSSFGGRVDGFGFFCELLQSVDVDQGDSRSDPIDPRACFARTSAG